MKSQEYWKERFLILEESLLNRGDNYFYTLSKQYEKAAANIQKEINAWYTRFATENEISMTEAKRLLNSRELEEFRWSVEEYIKKGSTLSNPKWIKQLENASAKVHVSRLEALKTQMQAEIENLMGYEIDGLDKVLTGIYTDSYYGSAFEIHKGFGIGSNLMKLDTRKINLVLNKPWSVDGKNFSERIWGDRRSTLVNTLNNDFVQSIIRGDDPRKLINKVAEEFNTSKKKAGRLINTESAFFASAGQKACFDELDVEMFEIVSTLDSHNCGDCGDRENKPIPMTDYVVGVTAPPFHPNCRCCTVPYFEDNEIAERAARDEQGNYYAVRGDTTYNDWKKAFVDGGSKEGLTPIKIDKGTIISLPDLLSQKQTLLADKVNKSKEIQKEVKEAPIKLADLEDSKMKLEKRLNERIPLDGRDLDSELIEKQNALVPLKKELEELDAISERYYSDRPERGTDAYNEWREFKRNTDIGDIFNKQVDNRMKQSQIENEIKELKRLMDVKKNVSVSDLTDELSKIQKDIDSLNDLINQSPVDLSKLNDEIEDIQAEIVEARKNLDFKTKVESIKKDIAIYGEPKEALLKEAGVDIRKAIADEKQPLKEAYEKAREELNKKFPIEELKKRRDELYNELYKKTSKTYDFEERQKLIEEWEAVKKELFDLYGSEDYIAASREVEALKRNYEGTYKDNAKNLKDRLSKIRSMGSGGIDFNKVHFSNRGTMRKVVSEAYENYPTEWIDKSIKRGMLEVKKVSRGYYSSFNKVIAISEYAGADQSFRTAIHELGHRFEDIHESIVKAETLFYNRRTAGENLEWMGVGYGREEKTRKDNFLDKYMGKDYGGKFYELVSMGFQYAYTDPTFLMKDEDFADFIYGVLSLL